MNKKICFFTDTVFTLGGIQRVITIVANELFLRGYEVTIICTNKQYEKDNSLYGLNENIKIKFISSSIFEKILMSWVYILKKIILRFSFLQKNVKLINLCYCKQNFFQNKKIVKFINKNKFDSVIGIATIHALRLCLLKNKISSKIIGWQHSSCKGIFEKSIGEKIIKNAFRKEIVLLDDYIVLTENDIKWIKDNFNYNAKCIYNPKSFITPKKSDLDVKNFIAVGRFSHVKGYDRLIEAFNIFAKKNREWNLQIVGDGELKEQLQQKIDILNLNDRVTLVPKTNDIKKYYLNSSVYLLSSYNEGLPMVLIEACECGLPIISFDLPCCVEQFNECSIIVKNNDINGFANAMLELANNPDMLKKLSKKSIENSKKYSIESIMEKWEEVL